MIYDNASLILLTYSYIVLKPSSVTYVPFITYYSIKILLIVLNLDQKLIRQKHTQFCLISHLILFLYIGVYILCEVKYSNTSREKRLDLIKRKVIILCSCGDKFPTPMRILHVLCIPPTEMLTSQWCFINAAYNVIWCPLLVT